MPFGLDGGDRAVIYYFVTTILDQYLVLALLAAPIVGAYITFLALH